MTERPRSSSILNNMLMKAAAKHPGLVPKVLRKSFITTIVAQMLPEGAFLKGGSALALRYPLTEARNSRDVDSTFTTSAEQFLAEFRDNLQEGWHGFTGVCEIEERKRYPKGVELHTLTVTLDYKGKRFATVDFEATPDLERHAPNTVRDMDDGTVELFTELGFPVRPPLMSSREDQLADKLNALSNPNKRRGKDLRDIEVMMRHSTPDLHKLRAAVRASERVPGGHEVHVLDTDMGEYLDSYSDARGEDIEHAWELANSLLEQVDCEYAYLWKDRWEDEHPSSDPELERQGMEEARITRAYLEQQQPTPATAMPPLKHGGPVQVRSYRRKDGTVVHGYTRRK